MATIRDVAKTSGVSVATVSRVLNGDPVVTESTREKVQQAIKELDYRPNLLGKGLRQAQTKKMLVLLPSISNTFYTRIIRNMENEAQKSGYSIVIGVTHSNREKELEYLQMLDTRLVDGAILLSSEQGKEELSQIAKRYPIVQCSEYIPDAGCDTVTIDNEQAAYDAVEELISLGHRRIAFAGSKKPYTSAILREKGYRRALEHAGLRIEESLIIKGDYSFVSGGEMFEQLMAQEQPPTAIFTIADSIAIGMLRASYQNEKFQKNPVAISGFDDTSLAQIYVPALSTVAQPRREIGTLAMQMLCSRIADREQPVRFVMLKHQYIKRESTFPKK